MKKDEIEIGVSLIVEEHEMYLRLSLNKETIDLPMQEANRFMEAIRALVPYRYGQHVWFKPIKFVGKKVNTKI